MTWGFERDQRNLKFETGKMEGVKGETDVMKKKNYFRIFVKAGRDFYVLLVVGVVGDRL